MPQYNVTGIVLRRTLYGETDNIVTLYTRERGQIHAVAKGARKAGSRLAGASEVLACARYAVASGKSLDVITQAEVKNSFPALRKDLARLACAQYMAEVLHHFVVDEDPHPDLFSLLRASLLLMERTVDAETAVRWFELRLLDLAGYGPDFTSCGVCDAPIPGDDPSTSATFALSVESGQALCPEDAHPDGYADHCPLSFDALDYLQHLNAHGVDHLKNVARIDPPSRQTAGMVRTALRRTIRWRIDSELRSVAFMDSTLATRDDAITSPPSHNP